MDRVEGVEGVEVRCVNSAVKIDDDSGKIDVPDPCGDQTHDDSLNDGETSGLIHHKIFDMLKFSDSARKRALKETMRIAREDHSDQRERLPSHITFTEEDMVATPRVRPLCVTAEINGVSFRRTMIDNGISINVMPRLTFEVANIPNSCLVKENPSGTEVSGMGNTMGHVTVRLQVGEIRSDTLFYVIDTNSAFHLILGRQWIHQHQGIPSTFHQCFKGIFQGKEVVIKASQNPFESHEMDLPDAFLYRESAPEEPGAQQFYVGRV